MLKLQKKDMLSIDIGTHTIKLVEGKVINDILSIKKAITVQTPEGSYFDGQVLNIDELQRLIKGTLVSNKIKVNNAIFTLESSTIVTRKINLPNVKETEMHEMIKFEIKETLPIDLEKYVVQYKFLEYFFEEGIQKCKILVSVLPKEIVDNYLMLTKTLKLKPIALDIHSNSNEKLFKSLFKMNENTKISNQTIVVLDMGYNTINLVILKKGIFEFNRIINAGGKNIDENISRLFNISISEAERKKYDIKDINNSSAELDSLRLYNIAKSSIDNWLDQITRMLKYYCSRTPGGTIENTIDAIYIHGGIANLGGIRRYLEASLDIPTFKIEDFSNIDTTKVENDIDLASYINAIGAIIRK